MYRSRRASGPSPEYCEDKGRRARWGLNPSLPSKARVIAFARVCTWRLIGNVYCPLLSRCVLFVGTPILPKEQGNPGTQTQRQPAKSVLLHQKTLQLLGAKRDNVGRHYNVILAEGAIALSVTLSGGALFAS